MKVGHTEYYIEALQPDTFTVMSRVWNTGMLGRQQWFTNFVAEFDTEAGAIACIAKLEKSK